MRFIKNNANKPFMRIAILNLTAGGMSGGYRKYLCNVIPRLAIRHEIERILCISPAGLAVKGWIGELTNVEYASCQPLGSLVCNKNPGITTLLKKFSPDVIFVPVERSFSFKNVPVVTMIQNMEPFAGVDEERVLQKLKNLFHIISAKKAARKAQRVIAVSEFVKNFLINRWGIPGIKLTGCITGAKHQKKIILSGLQTCPQAGMARLFLPRGR